MLPDEAFMQKVRQIDFSKDVDVSALQAKADEDARDNPYESKWHKTRVEVAEHLGCDHSWPQWQLS